MKIKGSEKLFLFIFLNSKKYKILKGGVDMFIGIDVRDTKIAVGLVNDKEQLSFDNMFPNDSEKSLDTLMLDIIFIIKNISDTIPLELFNDRLLGIGICIQETLDKDGILQEVVQGHFQIPVFVERLTVTTDESEDETGTLKVNISNARIIAAALLCKKRG